METPRTPPFSVEAEESLLACAFIDAPDTLSKCMDAGINPNSFYSPPCRVVYEIMTGLYATGLQPDAVLVIEEARKQGTLDGIGGYAYLVQVTGRVPTTAQVPYFIERVFDLAQRRKIIGVAIRASELCYELDGKVGDQLSKSVNDMLTLVAGSDTHTEPDWAEVCDEAGRIAQSLIDHQGKPAHMTIKWPWREMDDRFGSLERGQLVCIGARPSVGKSSLLRQMALSCAEQGFPVYFVTLEVNPAQVPMQMAAMKTRIGVRQLPSSHVKDQQDFQKALRSLRALGITISRRDRSLAKITGRARALCSKRKLGMLCIDYLGLMDDVQQASAKEMVVTIGAVTKTLKRLAVEEGIVVVMAAQLNRLSSYDGNREPKLSDLKASGDIEADVDVCALLHRPDVNPHTKLPQPETSDVSQMPSFYQKLLLAKGRDCGTSYMDMSFSRATASFSPMVR